MSYDVGTREDAYGNARMSMDSDGNSRHRRLVGKPTKRLKTPVKKSRTVKKVAAKKPRAKKSAPARTVKTILAAGPCRMIFIDVENTSSEERLASVLDHLKI